MPILTSEPVIRHFMNFSMIPTSEALVSGEVTNYEVGKLALNLLPILLSRIKTLGQIDAQVVAVLLRRHPPPHLLGNDPLELEKVKAAQAIQEFLEV